MLGWLRAGREYRLVLVNNYSPRSAYLLYGTTYSPRTLGLPDSFITELKSKIKNLNTDQVMCLYWDNRKTSLRNLESPILFLALAVFLISLFPLLLMIFLRRRPRRQMKWLLERVASSQPINH
jgi:hypothetical protein